MPFATGDGRHGLVGAVVVRLPELGNGNFNGCYDAGKGVDLELKDIILE